MKTTKIFRLDDSKDDEKTVDEVEDSHEEEEEGDDCSGCVGDPFLLLDLLVVSPLAPPVHLWFLIPPLQPMVHEPPWCGFTSAILLLLSLKGGTKP